MLKLFLIGTGKMATAIAGGLVKKSIFSTEEIAGYDVNPAAAELFTQTTGVPHVSKFLPFDELKQAAVLIAVKPQMAKAALEAHQDLLSRLPVISIMAGVPISRIVQLTGSVRAVRVMPNTPALVGCGAAAFAAAPDATAKDVGLVKTIFNAIGTAIQLKENDLDAVTALSGSGPGYVFEFIQALADGGVAEGLPRDVALKLAAQTVLGSAQMVLETGEHPASLKDKVTSPAGTTSRALELLAERGFAGTVMQAVRAAAQRSRELGKL